MKYLKPTFWLKRKVKIELKYVFISSREMQLCRQSAVLSEGVQHHICSKALTKIFMKKNASQSLFRKTPTSPDGQHTSASRYIQAVIWSRQLKVSRFWWNFCWKKSGLGKYFNCGWGGGCKSRSQALLHGAIWKKQINFVFFYYGAKVMPLFFISYGSWVRQILQTRY